MDLSPETEAVINFLNDSVEGGLRKHNDVAIILELAMRSDDAELFNDITRTGAATWKVYGTLRRVQQGQEGYRQLEDEFARQLNTLRELMAKLMPAADDETLRRFDDVYFGMSQGVMRNLVDLSHDLAKIKDLQR